MLVGNIIKYVNPSFLLLTQKISNKSFLSRSDENIWFNAQQCVQVARLLLYNVISGTPLSAMNGLCIILEGGSSGRLPDMTDTDSGAKCAGKEGSIITGHYWCYCCHFSFNI